DDITAGNSASCGNNVKAMEGLTPQFSGDPNTLMGGTDDDDSSGILQYVSLRYGGRVLGLGNELNGLSLGAIGRGTQIDHIDIMNNVDDGIEIWGGTVNLKYINIWNIGDDCFDVDCGWRGKAQFGLIVQGYSQDAAQGSGIGDNIFEMDGAEQADAQPNSAGCIYNFTVIGQPVAGDHGTAWRDEARMQFRQCIFMDLGEDLVHNDNTDGDSGSVGYTIGGGALTFSQIWTTPYTTFPVPHACANPAQVYQSQSAGSAAIGQGFLAEITDSVFFRNFDGGGANADGYSNSNGANTVGVTSGSRGNPAKGNVVAAYGGAGNPDLNMPIKALTRHAVELLQGNTIPLIRVIGIDPRAANAAVTSNSTPPADGFFNPATYRGAFSPDKNWLCGWTAADAYGFLIKPSGACQSCCEADIAPYGRPDHQVNIDDLTAVILGWGTSNPSGDVNRDGAVNIDDLTAVILSWGACP
ncbi:MAG TPA: GC-type dockerin domain-anchored protein, partial [Phycisphaerales bacterium]|nr:GC-type dockerin domain-anchored protein [Phycisphaerales bacterium]